MLTEPETVAGVRGGRFPEEGLVEGFRDDVLDGGVGADVLDVVLVEGFEVRGAEGRGGDGEGEVVFDF